VTSDSPVAFFSYCREDSSFALRLAGDLKAAGAKVWVDQLDIRPGQRWDRAVEEALKNCARMVVILSPASVNSNNVLDEVSFALEEQKTVIPVICRDCSVPFRLRRLQHVDFRTDYARALQGLLKCLAPEQGAGPSVPSVSEEVSQTAPSLPAFDEGAVTLKPVAAEKTQTEPSNEALPRAENTAPISGPESEAELKPQQDETLESQQQQLEAKIQRDKHYGEGLARFEKGDLDGAIEEFREVVRLQPSDADGHEALAKALNENGNADEALEHYTLAIEANPSSAELNFQVGLILFVKGNLKQAVSAFRKATSLQPGDPIYHYNLAICLEARGHRAAAKKEAEIAYEIDSNDRDIRSALERLCGSPPEPLEWSSSAEARGDAPTDEGSDRIARYKAHYQNMKDEELLAIDASREDLVPDAVVALRAVLRKRGLPVAVRNSAEGF
jgi:Flp pilus assembly protein TadD